MKISPGNVSLNGKLKTHREMVLQLENENSPGNVSLNGKLKSYREMVLTGKCKSQREIEILPANGFAIGK